MNQDEILKIIGPNNFPIAYGGSNSDNFDNDCEIYNLVIFDGKNIYDEITTHGSNILKISHGNLFENKSEYLIQYENLQIIQDEKWELKMLISKIQEKKNILFSASAKNALVESQLALSKAKNALEHDDLFASCWIKCGVISLIDSILFQNQILPSPANALSSMRNLKQKNTNNFTDKIISETGIERATTSLLSRMLKSTCGFSDMVEKNQNSIIIERKANHLIQNSLLSDCYLYLNYQNKNNFYKIKNTLNTNLDKIHVLKTAFDLTNISSELLSSVESMSDVTNMLLALSHQS
ncbi:hypothetical protein OAJ83_04615 [Candidatus Nitrosopelagicus sp.]|nr:hypothetical protein [Candidatus Nitrosopelagicus sp.]